MTEAEARDRIADLGWTIAYEDEKSVRAEKSTARIKDVSAASLEELVAQIEAVES